MVRCLNQSSDNSLDIDNTNTKQEIMKLKLTLISTALIASLGLSAQSSLSYSLARPVGGGDMKLLETNLATSAETVIDSYTAAEIDDYDPGSTTFDHQSGRFITLSSDMGGNVSVIGLNVTNGDIDYSYTSSNYELFSVEYYLGKVYSLARPIGGGDLKLLETDLTTGTETVIDTYSAAEIDDYDPGATTFDHQNGRFIALSSDMGGNVSVVGLNISNGDIEYTHGSINYELFSVEYYDGNVYSLARPMGGGDMKLLETNLSVGTERVVDTYPETEIDDYDPGATSFDHQNARFITLASDTISDPILVALDNINGDIDYSFESTTYELFSIETAGTLLLGSVENSNTYDLINIYPNPAYNLITINSIQKYDRIEIGDVLGRSLLLSNNNNTVIDVSVLPSGSYWIRLSNEKETRTEKFIKK